MVGYYVSDCGYKDNGFVKLKKGGYKTPAQLEKEGYKVVQFHGIIPGREVQHTGYVFIRGKEVTIAYRGTCNLDDFKTDVEIPLIRQYELLPKGGKIHLGFYSVFENSWESLYGILKRYANDRVLEIRDLKINLTGHSMGGAVANIAALCLSVTEDAKDLHIATFGAPRVFNRNAAKVCNELFGRKTIRVVDRSDFIPSLPPNFMGYKHVGKQLKIGRHSVPALHDHKLEVYHDLILKIKPKNFKSDNSTSATCYILSRAAREVYDVLTVPSCLIPSTHSSSDKQYFERVKDQHKNASFSEIINKYPELSNRNDKFLDKDRRNGIMGDIRASIKKSRGNYNNKEGVMTKFKEQSEKSVSWEGGLSNIDNLTNSKERSAGKMTDFEKQNRGNMTGVAESFENWENSGEIPGIDSPNNLEEGKKTVAELAGYFNERLGNPKELPSKLTRIGVPTMGISLKQSKNKSVSLAEGLSNVNSLTDFKQSKKKSVSFAEGLSDVNNLTDSGIETPDADKLTDSKEKEQNKNPGILKRLSNRLSPKKKTQSMLSTSGSGKYKKLDEGFFEASTITDTNNNEKQSSYQSDNENNPSLNVSNVSTTEEQRNERSNSSEELPKADKKLIDAIKKLDFKKARECIKKRKSIILITSAESMLKGVVEEAKKEISDLPGKERNKQESKLQEIRDLINEKLYVIQDDHVPSVNGLDRAELEKAESEKFVAESTELEKAESEAEFERLAAASTEREKAESEAEFEKIVAASAELEKAASVQDLYLDHAQPVNANSSAEDVSAEKQALTQFAELQTDDELDSSSGEPLYSTIGSGSSDSQSANGDDSQNLQPENPVLTSIATDSDVLDSSSEDVSDTTGTIADQSTEYITPQTSDTPDSPSDKGNPQLKSEGDPQDDVSSLSSDEHSSASLNADTTENVTDNEEEPVVDSKNDQPADKEGDSKSPVTFIIEGDDNKVVIEQDNSVKTHPQSTKSSKLPVIAASALALAGVASGAAIVVCLEMLAVGIAVGASCLVAAAVIYCCTPKSSVESNNVTKLTGDELAAQQTVN